MPTVHNGGRFIWGSAWRLEPRRGNEARQRLRSCRGFFYSLGV
jgi:hypothetical protein